MSNTLTVAMLVTDANKAGVISAINALTPNYTINFLRGCCSSSEPNPTWQTPPTHWYNNASAVDIAIVGAWQAAVDDADPGDALYGLKIFTGQNITNALGWAGTNLASQGLMLVPDEE